MLYFNSCLIVVLLVISNFSSLSNASSTSAALRLNEMVVTKAMQSPEVQQMAQQFAEQMEKSAQGGVVDTVD